MDCPAHKPTRGPARYWPTNDPPCLRVTIMDNGRSVKVSINDRGPHVKDRIIDLFHAAARALGMSKRGVVQAKLEAFPDDQS
jgi:rare lipoprotein A